MSNFRENTSNKADDISAAYDNLTNKTDSTFDPIHGSSSNNANSFSTDPTTGVNGTPAGSAPQAGSTAGTDSKYGSTGAGLGQSTGAGLGGAAGAAGAAGVGAGTAFASGTQSDAYGKPQGQTHGKTSGSSETSGKKDASLGDRILSHIPGTTEYEERKEGITPGTSKKAEEAGHHSSHHSKDSEKSHHSHSSHSGSHTTTSDSGIRSEYNTSSTTREIKPGEKVTEHHHHHHHQAHPEGGAGVYHPTLGHHNDVLNQPGDTGVNPTSLGTEGNIQPAAGFAARGSNSRVL